MVTPAGNSSEDKAVYSSLEEGKVVIPAEVSEVPGAVGAGALAVPGAQLLQPLAPQVRPPAPLRLLPPLEPLPPAAPPSGSWLKKMPGQVILVGAGYLAMHVGWGLYEAGRPEDVPADYQESAEELLGVYATLVPFEHHEAFVENFWNDTEHALPLVMQFAHLMRNANPTEEEIERFVRFSMLVMRRNLGMNEEEYSDSQIDWEWYEWQQRKLLAESFHRNNPHISLSQCYLMFGLSPMGLRMDWYNLATSSSQSSAIPFGTPMALHGNSGASGAIPGNPLSSEDEEFRRLAELAGLQSPSLSYKLVPGDFGDMVLVGEDFVSVDMVQMAICLEAVAAMVYPEQQIVVELHINYDGRLSDLSDADLRPITNIVYEAAASILNFNNRGLAGFRVVFHSESGRNYPGTLTPKHFENLQGRRGPQLTHSTLDAQDVLQPIVRLRGNPSWEPLVHLGNKMKADGQEVAVIYDYGRGGVRYVSPENVEPEQPHHVIGVFLTELIEVHARIAQAFEQFRNDLDPERWERFVQLGNEAQDIASDLQILPPRVTLRRMMELHYRMRVEFGGLIDNPTNKNLWSADGFTPIFIYARGALADWGSVVRNRYPMAYNPFPNYWRYDRFSQFSAVR